MTLQELYDKDAKLIKEGLKIRHPSSGRVSSYYKIDKGFCIFGARGGPSFSLEMLRKRTSAASIFDVILEIEGLEI